MDEAVSALERYLEHRPDSAKAYFQLGQAFMYLKQYDRARKCHETALRNDPQFAQACFGLSMACERLGEMDLARQYREQYKQMIAQSRLAEQRRVRQNRDAAELAASLARAYATAGRIYLDHGRPREAEELWRQAKAIDPNLDLPDLSAIR
jgi:tetratricopeptide (TPR) repeat protein